MGTAVCSTHREGVGGGCCDVFCKQWVGGKMTYERIQGWREDRGAVQDLDFREQGGGMWCVCLLYTSDAADDC